jgi:hypothetical protein
MRKFESECVCCPMEMGCYGSSCPLFSVEHYYCDRCGTEDKLYYYDNEELCASCLLDEFDVVEGSDYYWL